MDTSNFPLIKAKFALYNSLGKQIINLSSSDFKITEDGKDRKVINVSCPILKPAENLSTVLVIDISGSMAVGVKDIPNIKLAKEAARAWINGLREVGNECAIVAFDHMNYLIQDFTTDKKKLLNAIEKLTPQGGTNYDMALLNPMAGGLLVTKYAKFKKVIVFLSDGMPNQEPKTDEIIEEAKRQNVIIYGVTLGLPCHHSIKK